MSFLEQVYEAGTPRESKADVIAHYQEKFTGRGQAGWKQTLIHALLGSQDITKGSIGDVEYKRLAKNMARRFDPSRLNSPEPRNTEQYRELGATLPPIAPYGYHITGIIYVKYSDDCVERHIDEEITGDAAKELAKMAEAEMLQAMANAYQSQEGDIGYKGPSIGDCGEPDVTVEAVEE